MDPELAELLSAWLGDEVGDGRRETLLARLGADAAFRTAFVEQVRLLGVLKVVRSAAPRWLRLEDELGWSADDEPSSARFEDAVAERVRELPPPKPPRRLRWWRWALAACLLGGVIAIVWLTRSRPQAPPTLASEDIALVARLDRAVWNGGPERAEGTVIQIGPLALREGTATLTFFNGATVHVEGPAAIDLLSPKGVSCRRGRLWVNVPPEAEGFSVAAPGAAVTDSIGEFMLTVMDDGQSEVTVLDGRSEVSVLDRAGQTLRTETLASGQAVQIDPGAGRITIAAKVGPLAGRIPPGTPLLALDAAYPGAVLADRPSGYWRFESAGDGVIPNEIAEGPPLRLIGLPTLSEPAEGNRSLYFPVTITGGPHGALSDEPWRPTGRDFAVECWVMPRLARQAAVVGLLVDVNAHQLDLHTFLLELTGRTPPLQHPPTRFRALYRVPAGRGHGQGINLFSSAAYQPNRWQHVVAQRSGDRLELYLNGERVAEVPAGGDERLPACRLLLGALYALRDGKACSERLFAGLLDEVAIYDRPLAPPAVRRHFELGRPGGAPK